MKYVVKYEYSVPEWTEIELTAKDKDEAVEQAQREFDSLYPEAIDPIVLGVEEIA